MIHQAIKANRSAKPSQKARWVDLGIVFFGGVFMAHDKSM
jgi:hypothetical protein